VAVLDIVIATGAVPLEGTTRQYVGDAPLPPIAHHDIVSALVRAASAGERHWHTGLLATQDAFYQEASRIADLDAFGVLATEMETSAIFTVAALRGLRAGSACLVLDRVQDRSTWASEQDQFDGIADLITLGLSAAVEPGSAPPGVAG
jgi:purine-nucleoside phosphorylase